MRAARRNDLDTNRALIAAFERARTVHAQRDLSQLFSMALMGVFFIALMAGLASGASLYRFASQAQLAANDRHLQSGLLANVIRANDLAGAVGEGTGPEGPALVLRRSLASGTYETRIYLYEGHVVQELSAASRPYDPQNAVELMATSVFSFEREDELLTITTDTGSFSVALRADGEAAEQPAATGGGELTVIDDDAPGVGGGELITITDDEGGAL